MKQAPALQQKRFYPFTHSKHRTSSIRVTLCQYVCLWPWAIVRYSFCLPPKSGSQILRLEQTTTAYKNRNQRTIDRKFLSLGMTAKRCENRFFIAITCTNAPSNRIYLNIPEMDE